MTKQISMTQPITVGTYNILFPQTKIPPDNFCTKLGYGIDRKGNLFNNINFRLNVIVKNILNAHLDVICLQEMTQQAVYKLKANLSRSYSLLWTPHTEKSHGVGILYNKHKFNKLDEKQLKLAFTLPPQNDSVIPKKKIRVSLQLDLQDRTTQKIFRVVSCHFLDPRDFQDKGINVRPVVDFANRSPKKYRIHRTIIAGDMNQDQHGDIGGKRAHEPSAKAASAFRHLVEHGYEVDDNLDASEHDRKDFGQGPIISKPRRIDWVWSKGSKPVHLPLPGFDIRGSDHRLTASVID